VIESKIGQRVVGLILVVGGGLLIAWLWSRPFTGGRAEGMAAGVMPFVVVSALGMILFPLDVDRLRAEHGVSQLSKWRHCPTIWKVMFVFAGLAAVGNWFALSQR